MAIGKAAGEFYATTLLPDGGKVIEIAGLPGSTPAAERAQGFRDGIAANPKIQIVASQPGDWLREKGQSVADALIKAHPDVSAIYAHNDPMAEGAYLAAKSAGKAQRIKFTGIDALPVPSGGIKAVEQGRLAATFQYATGGGRRSSWPGRSSSTAPRTSRVPPRWAPCGSPGRTPPRRTRSSAASERGAGMRSASVRRAAPVVLGVDIGTSSSKGFSSTPTGGWSGPGPGAPGRPARPWPGRDGRPDLVAGVRRPQPGSAGSG
ncbi:substrate-binding domain-containing protein [Micromonospora sp. BRA006-A]|nr:substrate-binding domain-containing protein [Micromonospora sp. BRA006-A]